MSNRLKVWWQMRHAKHYVKSHWHLFADILFLIIILGLAVSLIVITQSAKPKVDTSSVPHVSKITMGTTTESLLVSAIVDKTNINSGKPFSVHLSLENNGNYDISELNLVPTFSVAGFVISNLENNSASSTIEIKNNKLFLDKIKAGEKVEADISLIVNAKTDSTRLINWTLKASYNENNKGYTSSYKLTSLKLITDLKVKANAYYHSSQGDQLGSGPIPPMVGLPTNYWVFFEIDNRGNDLSSLTVSAKLPESVTLSSGKTLSIGELVYDESQKRITWTVGKAVVNNGRYQAGFEVQLFPVAKQVGLEPLLLSNISYVATDAYTGEKLSGKLSNINTELPLDSINQGQGKVLE